MVLGNFLLERYFNRFEHSVPHLLCASDCESWSIEELIALEPESAAGLMRLRLGYSEPQGAPGLRALIAQQYKGLGAENILVHVGAEEAIFTTMNVLLSAGDRVVVHHPCYQSLEEIARSIGCEVLRWQAREENGWQLDLDFLKTQLAAGKIRLVVVNSPHNPTGSLLDRAFYDELLSLCRQAGAYLFFDEVYRGLEYDPATRLPPVASEFERGISLGVMSKAYGLAGLRVGWIATQDKNLLSALSAYRDYLTICTPAPSEFLAELALKHEAVVRGRCLDLTLANLTLLRPVLAAHAELLVWVEPRAGVIGLVRWKGPGTVNDLCDDLLKKTGVLLLPGEVYGMPEHFRIGYGRADFGVGLSKLGEYLQTISQKRSC